MVVDDDGNMHTVQCKYVVRLRLSSCKVGKNNFIVAPNNKLVHMHTGIGLFPSL